MIGIPLTMKTPPLASSLTMVAETDVKARLTAGIRDEVQFHVGTTYVPGSKIASIDIRLKPRLSH